MAVVKWDVEFYERSNGRCPAREFFATLTDPAFVRRALDRLAIYGHKLDRPHVAYLRDQIYELRIRTTDGQLRFLYFFFDGQTIIVTHGFRKKTSAVPPGEIETAIRHRADYLSRRGKG
jgi:phage-related protein